MPTRRPYPSDLTDARWELIEPVLSAWRFERRGRALDFGRPPEHDLRDIMDAILYVDRTGVQWRYLPHDFPHWNTVYGYFAKWQQDGVFAQLNGLLRQLLREKEGRNAEPSACVIDAAPARALPRRRRQVPKGGRGPQARRGPQDRPRASQRLRAVALAAWPRDRQPSARPEAVLCASPTKSTPLAARGVPAETEQDDVAGASHCARHDKLCLPTPRL
ncbi:transposase, partial [Streptomyces sp. F-1]|uniref:transposase n=1 Tax=Streptomyces sp. F-1 TaxID=463642 RepID=UPI001EFAAA57